MTPTDPKRIVAAGYDAMAERYLAFSARVNRRLVAAAGLVIERAEIATEPEDRHDARFLWVVARAPAAPAGR